MTSWHPILLALGLLLLFLGGVFSPGTLGASLLWTGRLLVAAAVALRVTSFMKLESPAAKRVGGWILAAYGGVVVGLALCFFASSEGLALLGAEPSGTLTTFLRFLWPAVLLGSLLPLLSMESVYGFMPVEEAVDIRRIRSAAYGALTVAFALIFLVSLNVSARERDVREDFSYFKVTEPSAGTLQTVRALDEDLRIVLLYPNGNDVLLRMQGYFQNLAEASKHLKVEVRDHALAPTLTKKHAIQDNGYVVFVLGADEAEARVQKINVGTELFGARSALRTLDGQVRRVLAQLTTIPRELYLTAGHGERGVAPAEGEAAGETLRLLETALRESNISVRTLGLAEGLGEKVPDKAPAVAVVGPRKPFLPEETDALIRYLKGGGKVAFFLDPGVDHGLAPLLDALGLKSEVGTLASERFFIVRTNTLADRTIVRTNRYSAHPTVSLAMRNASRGIASVFIGGGAIVNTTASAMERRIKGVRSVFPITTTTDYWLDTNGNYEKEPEEESRPFNLMAAVTIPNTASPGERGADAKEGRAVVVADGDFITDAVIRNPGNGLVLSDILEWLIGQQQIVGDVSSEEDVELERTNEEDKLIFWGFGLLLPLLVASPAGWLAWARRRGRREGPGAPGARGKDGAGVGPGNADSAALHQKGKDGERASTESASPRREDEGTGEADVAAATKRDGDRSGPARENEGRRP